MSPMIQTAQAAAEAARAAVVLAGRICPQAPPGAEAPVAQMEGYVLWGVIVLFAIGVVTGIGSVVGGRVFGMRHASQAGVISIVVVFVAAIGYLVLPPIVGALIGRGCVG